MGREGWGGGIVRNEEGGVSAAPGHLNAHTTQSTSRPARPTSCSTAAMPDTK